MKGAPPIFAANGIHFLDFFWKRDYHRTLRVSFKLELITMLRADNPMVGRVGFEPTHL